MCFVWREMKTIAVPECGGKIWKKRSISYNFGNILNDN